MNDPISLFFIAVYAISIYLVFRKTKPEKAYCSRGDNYKFGKDLIFISAIKRDGLGVHIVHENMEHLDDTQFAINCLSITNRTYIASEFNSYVVKFKNDKP